MLKIIQKKLAMQFQTPVLLLTFTRLNTTEKVFAKIKEIKPERLFIASDGPRKGNESDARQIDIVRNYLLSQIDWACRVETLFQTKNLGCGVAPHTAITWFFSHVSRGIILEDDCLPQGDFFSFCEQMLEYYENDSQIREISGTSLQNGIQRGDGSYYFSRYGGIWGWATWARAWRDYDYEMKAYKDFKDKNQISNIFASKKQQKYWIKTFDNAAKLGTWWDYQWVFSIWRNNGLCIVPNRNLIRNIGFNSEGTHTTDEPAWYSLLAAGDGNLGALIHPKVTRINVEADNFQFKKCVSPPSLLQRALRFALKKVNL